MPGYAQAVARERQIYSECTDVHRLPGIFHYWSVEHLRPKLNAFGFDDITDFLTQSLIAAAPRHIVSLGSGNCDLEIELAQGLEAAGLDRFTFDCVDLNEAMLERGRAAALEAGLADRFNFIQADLNEWRAAHDYDAAIANQSLHHVVNLEGLFDEVKRALAPRGVLIAADMIGRNGHRRWPEALEIVEEFWRLLPPSRRFNRKLGRYEERFLDWDCSVEGFEGVRSQDILPLLAGRFHFHTFLPFGNVIDPFIDRAFGENFDPEAEWDRAFIDRVHLRDELELHTGRIKPTHMLAVMGIEPIAAPRYPAPLSPQLCIRDTDACIAVTNRNANLPVYDWNAIPHKRQSELETACARLTQTTIEMEARARWTRSIEAELEERTQWALALDAELQCCRDHAAMLERDFLARTEWALGVERELDASREIIGHRDLETDEMTAWARRLDEELAASGRNAMRMAEDAGRMAEDIRRLRQTMRNPLRYAEWFTTQCAKKLSGLFAGAVIRPRNQGSPR